MSTGFSFLLSIYGRGGYHPPVFAERFIIFLYNVYTLSLRPGLHRFCTNRSATSSFCRVLFRKGRNICSFCICSNSRSFRVLLFTILVNYIELSFIYGKIFNSSKCVEYLSENSFISRIAFCELTFCILMDSETKQLSAKSVSL